MTRRSRNKPKGEKNSQSASSRISQAVGNGIGRLTGKAKLSPPASEEEEEEKVPLSKQPSDGGKDKTKRVKVVIVWNYVVAVALDPIETIKNSIMAQTDEITAGRDKEPHTYANSDGHELLDDLQKIKGDNEELKGDNNDLRKQVQEILDKIADQQYTLTSTIKDVSQLKEQAGWYEAIRARQIAFYERDVLGTSNPHGRKAIKDGNKTAHEGDALQDAKLFEKDNLQNPAVYRGLYGLDFKKVLEYRDQVDATFLFVLLSKYATIRFKGFQPEAALENAFQAFLSLLQARGLDAIKTDKVLSRACRVFNDALRTRTDQVETIERERERQRRIGGGSTVAT